MQNKIKQIFPISHFQHCMIGLAEVVVGLILISNDYYFFWPPFMVGFLNDDLIGGAAVIFGLFTIKWAISDKSAVKTNRNLLLFSVFFWSFEITAELIHGFISNHPHMYTEAALESILLIMTWHLIGISEKQDDK